MNNIIPGLAVICLCGVIALVLFLFMRGSSISEFVRNFTTKINGRNDNRDGGSRNGNRGNGGRGCTVVCTKLFVDQLDEYSLDSVIASFPIGEISNRGVSISRPGALYGTVKLRDVGHSAYTVSEEHARIGHDEAGFYIQEREDGTTNGMFLGDGITMVKEAAITDGMVLYLGEQPIRFRFPKRNASHEESDRSSERPAHETKIMRRRNT